MKAVMPDICQVICGRLGSKGHETLMVELEVRVSIVDESRTIGARQPHRVQYVKYGLAGLNIVSFRIHLGTEGCNRLPPKYGVDEMR
jgi:hypothetical protein